MVYNRFVFEPREVVGREPDLKGVEAWALFTYT